MLVDLGELERGMTVREEVHVRGKVLLGRGAVLNDGTINMLRRWGVSSVDIAKQEKAAEIQAEERENTIRGGESEELREEKKRLDSLFGPVENDPQMQFLKRCEVQNIKRRLR